MNQFKNTAAAVIAIISCATISACHQNPLKISDTNKTITFLMSASREAGKSVGSPLGAHASNYSNCMSDNPAQIDCAAIFSAMLKVAHKTAGYKNLTLAELQDKKSFESIKDKYEHRVFYTLDEGF